MDNVIVHDVARHFQTKANNEKKRETLKDGLNEWCRVEAPVDKSFKSVESALSKWNEKTGKGRNRKEEDGFRRRLTGRHCSGFDAKDHVIKHGRQVAMNCTHFLAHARRRGTVAINTFVKFSRSSNTLM